MSTIKNYLGVLAALCLFSIPGQPSSGLGKNPSNFISDCDCAQRNKACVKAAKILEKSGDGRKAALDRCQVRLKECKQRCKGK
jgi:hypothetical protein